MVQDQTLLEHINFDAFKCSETMFSVIEHILDIHPLDTLDFLAVCRGPGSFTSSRISLMCIKTLGFSKNIPIISFDSHIPLRSNNFKKESILSHKTKTGATLSTGGGKPKFISISELSKNPPENMIEAPPYNFAALYQYLLKKAHAKTHCDPLKLTPIYLKNP